MLPISDGSSQFTACGTVSHKWETWGKIKQVGKKEGGVPDSMVTGAVLNQKTISASHAW